MNNYEPKFKRNNCPVCKGSGWVAAMDSTGYEVARPCKCEEGIQRRNALTKPKQEETDG